MAAGDTVESAHVDEFQDAIDEDNTSRRGLPANNWTYDPPTRDVGTEILAAVYNEISAYIVANWGAYISDPIVTAGNYILTEDMTFIKNGINAGRNDCVCNAFCSCNINCGCNKNCGCNYV
jgi:hypothetical protein